MKKLLAFGQCPDSYYCRVEWFWTALWLPNSVPDPTPKTQSYGEEAKCNAYDGKP